MSQPILSIAGIKKNFSGISALNNVNMTIESGRLTLLIGPNGSGKTTLINVISGFYKPDAGRILLQDIDITGQPPNQISKQGLTRTFQIPAPFQKLSVLENLLIASNSNPGESFFKAPFPRIWRKKEDEAHERAEKVLNLLNLKNPGQLAGELSGGQLKLLEVGRALMTGSKVILLDEPASGLNPTLAHAVFGHLNEIKTQLGLTFLVIEHRLDIALQYVDYVYALSYGSVISHGGVEEVLKDSKVIEGYLGGPCA